MITSLIPSFNAGELSPLINLRSDIEKYRAGCRTLENMHIIPHGGVRRRSGFAFVREANSECRLFRFQVSVTEGYVLEFGRKYIRVYNSDGGLEATLATPYELIGVRQLQMVQINSVAYFTHPKFQVRKFAHRVDGNGNKQWSFTRVSFAYPAMQDENLDKKRKITVEKTGKKGAKIFINSTHPIFTEVGAYFEISRPRRFDQYEMRTPAAANKDSKLSNTNTNHWVWVQGAWTLTTGGTWGGTFYVERSITGGTKWARIRRFKSNKDANFSAGGEEPKLVRMRVSWESNKNAAGFNASPHATLEASGTHIRGLVKVLRVNKEGTRAEVVVIRPVLEGSTTYWREGAWGRRKGYPRTVCAHEGRIIYGGSASFPQAVWASVVDDYENFQPGGTEDDDSWTHVIASDQQNDIQWMISQKSLLIGTSGDEWVLGSSQEETIITPTSVRARRHSGCGSEFIKARLVDDAVIFVQRGGQRARDMIFSFSADGYVSTDLTLLAEHITGGGKGITGMALQSHPESRLWCVTGNGELIVLTYDRGQSLTGWQRMTTGSEWDGFESVAILSRKGLEDQVWVSVRRRINGTDRRYIERMNTDGVFLSAPWSLLMPKADPWSDLYRFYPKGSLVYEGPEPWVPGDDCHLCVREHWESEDTYLGDSNWVLVKAWVPGRIYGPNEHVYHDGIICFPKTPLI